jgi:hydroxymethylpyrimidine/phosphomethylpyrimidine kinase
MDSKTSFLYNVYNAFIQASQKLDTDFEAYKKKTDIEINARKAVHDQLLALRDMISEEAIQNVKNKIQMVKDYVSQSKNDLVELQSIQQDVVDTVMVDNFESLLMLISIKDEISTLNKEVASTVFSQYKNDEDVLEIATPDNEEWIEGHALSLKFAHEYNTLLTGFEFSLRGKPYVTNGETGSFEDVDVPLLHMWINGEFIENIQVTSTSDSIKVVFDPILIVQNKDNHIRIDTLDATMNMSTSLESIFTGVISGQTCGIAMKTYGIKL